MKTEKLHMPKTILTFEPITNTMFWRMYLECVDHVFN